MRARAAGLVLLLTACSSSATPEPAPSPPSAVGVSADAPWTVELSTAPTLLAVTPDDVYVASYGNGVGGSQVYRVDRATGRLAQQRTLAGQPQGMAVAPDGRLWIATLRLPDQPTGTGVQVLDGDTLVTARAVTVDEVPLGIAFVGEDLWVGERGGVRRYDAQADALGPLVATTTPPYRMHAVEDDLLVAGLSGLERVDVATGAVVASTQVAASGSVSATVDDGRLWVVHPDAQAAAVLQRYDATSLQPGVTAPSPGGAGAGASLVGDALWVVDPGAAELRCADPDTGEVRSTRPVPRATGAVAADETSVLVALTGGLAVLPADC